MKENDADYCSIYVTVSFEKFIGYVVFFVHVTQ